MKYALQFKRTMAADKNWFWTQTSISQSVGDLAFATFLKSQAGALKLFKYTFYWTQLNSDDQQTNLETAQQLVVIWHNCSKSQKVLRVILEF